MSWLCIAQFLLLVEKKMRRAKRKAADVGYAGLETDDMYSVKNSRLVSSGKKSIFSVLGGQQIVRGNIEALIVNMVPIAYDTELEDYVTYTDCLMVVEDDYNGVLNDRLKLAAFSELINIVNSVMGTDYDVPHPELAEEDGERALSLVYLTEIKGRDKEFEHEAVSLMRKYPGAAFEMLDNSRLRYLVKMTHKQYNDMSPAVFMKDIVSMKRTFEALSGQ